MRMPIQAAAALLAALTLAGCASSPGMTAEVPQGAAVARLELMLPRSSDEQTQETMEYFARAANRLSDGELRINLATEDAPLESLAAGECSLALVPGEGLAALEPGLEMTVQPFFWRDYSHFTAALNRPDNLELAGSLLSESLGAQPLGVYYLGAVNLVSTQRLYDERGLEAVNMALPPSASDSYDSFASMDAPLRIYTRYDELVELLRDKEVRATEADAALARQLSGQFGRLYSIPTNHYRKGEWLLLSQRAADSLSEGQLAALREAFAESLAHNDARRLEAEQAVWTGEETGLIYLDEDFDRIRAMGERHLALDVIPRSGWSSQLLRGYRMGLTLVTEVPEAGEAPEDEEEEDLDEDFEG